MSNITNNRTKYVDLNMSDYSRQYLIYLIAETNNCSWNRHIIYKSYYRSLIGKDLKGLDLSNLDLNKINLSESNLTYAIFKGANLDGAVGLKL